MSKPKLVLIICREFNVLVLVFRIVVSSVFVTNVTFVYISMATNYKLKGKKKRTVSRHVLKSQLDINFY